MAAACVVSSLHDGMNLVAKEFVAARGDEQGVLVLSRFTGAARDLDGAVLVNPYAVDEFAEALHLALRMPMDEQARRMSRMRKHVQDNNVFRWAGMLLSEAGKLVGAREVVRVVAVRVARGFMRSQSEINRAVQSCLNTYRPGRSAIAHLAEHVERLRGDSSWSNDEIRIIDIRLRRILMELIGGEENSKT
jgi:hypothetical protein